MLKKETIITVAATVTIVVVCASIIAYAGSWPPVYDVQSKSMEHSESWTAGTINTGDLVFAKSIGKDSTNVVTYVQGRESGFSSYSDYGNVILFRGHQNNVMIHRAMFYLSWNGEVPVISHGVNSSWLTVNDSSVIIKNVGQSNRNLVVYLSDFAGKSGFITAGDYNIANSNVYNSTADAYVASDQNVFGLDPVSANGIIGKAFGNIPWFGLIKLNIMKLGGDWPQSNQVPDFAYLYLTLTIALIVALVFLPYGQIYGRIRKRRK